MKKGLKLGIVALALVAMAGTIYKTTVNAESALVQVTIIEGNNSCADMDDYVWTGIEASIQDTTLTGITNPLYCILLKDAAGHIDLELTDLMGSQALSSSLKIAKEKFKLAATEGIHTGSLVNFTAYPQTQYSSQVEIYSKAAHTVGEFTKDITLEGLVPAGTAVDVYTGQLNVSIIPSV